MRFFKDGDAGMNFTNNLGLNKPDTDDYYDVQHMNENMDKLDAAVKEKADISSLEAHILEKNNPHNVQPEQLGSGYITEGESGIVLDGTTQGKFEGTLDGTAKVAEKIEMDIYAPHGGVHTKQPVTISGPTAGMTGQFLLGGDGAGSNLTAVYPNDITVGMAADAKKLEGYPLFAKPTYKWGAIPYVGVDGVMEIGKYIDFHATNNDTSNNSARITADTSGLTISGTTRGAFEGDLDGTAAKASTIDVARNASDNVYRDVLFNHATDTSRVAAKSDFQYNPSSNILRVKKISIKSPGNSWIGGKTDAAVNISNAPTDGGYYPALRIPTQNGHVWSLGAIGDKVCVAGFFSDRTTNGTDWRTSWDVNTGDLTHDKKITATGGFFGDLHGSATRANQDGNGNIITDTYLKKNPQPSLSKKVEIVGAGSKTYEATYDSSMTYAGKASHIYLAIRNSDGETVASKMIPNFLYWYTNGEFSKEKLTYDIFSMSYGTSSYITLEQLDLKLVRNSKVITVTFESNMVRGSSSVISAYKAYVYDVLYS